MPFLRPRLYMARVGTANFKPGWGTENLVNQRESFWRQGINREYYAHPSNSLHIKVPQPSYHGLQTTSHDFMAKPWQVMSDASAQKIFPSAGKQTFYLGGGSTTTPIYPFEKYTSMRPPLSQRDNWLEQHPSARAPQSYRSMRSSSSAPMLSQRDGPASQRRFEDDVQSRRSSARSRSSARVSARSFERDDSRQVNLGSTRNELERVLGGPPSQRSAGRSAYG